MKNTFMFFLAALCLYQSASGQAIENVQLPVKMLTVTGSTSDDPAAYVFEEVANSLQGVNIHLPPTEAAFIFMQSGNCRLTFNTLTTSFFFNKLDVNYDNTGWISLYDGATKQSHGWIEPPGSFQTLGSHNLQVRYFNSLAGWRYREYNVVMTPPADEFHRDGQRSYTQGGNLLTTGNQIYLYDHPNCLDADPVLVVEGFDPANTTFPEFYRFRGAFLSNKLYELGYKVYVLNFNMNSQSMFNNASVVSSAINYISSLNDDKNLLLIGASMGGVISRFVTARAENDGVSLPISGLITLDAPHQGAILDAELQDYLKDCDSNLAEAIIGSQAAKELLTFNTFDPTGVSRTTFMDSLSGLTGGGYPLSIPVMGVAHSTIAPHPNSPNDIWLDVQNITCSSKNFSLTEATTAPGSLLSEGFTQIDPVRFYYWTISINRLLDPTFVSHASALDFDTLGIPSMLFPISSTDSLPNFHDVIPNSVVFAIEDRLQNFTPATILASQTYNYSSVVGDQIKRDIDVYGTLKSNEEGYTGFQHDPLPGSPLTDYTLATNRCNPVTVDIKNGGIFDIGITSDRRSTTIIGNGSTLIIRDGGFLNAQWGSQVILEEGAEMRVESGGTLRISQYSSLTIEPGATLTLENGAIVQLWDGHHPYGNARIEVKGELHVDDQIDFSGNGFFDFFNGHILSLPSGQLTLIGMQKDTRMIRLQPNAQLNGDGTKFTFKNGLIEYLSSSSVIKVTNEGQLTTDHVTFKNEDNATNAIDAYQYERLLINASDFVGFEGDALVAESTTHSSFWHTRVIDCNFIDNEHGMLLLDLDQAYINGCHFTSQLNGSRGILLHNIDQLSILDTHFDHLHIGIEVFKGQSIGRIVLSNTILEHNNYGVLCANEQSSLNLIARLGTVFENNGTAIQIATGWISQNGLDHGMVKLDCAALINNDIGIKGKDLFLQIDAFLNSHPDPQYTRSNRFECDDTNGQLLFDLCFINRPISHIEPILARGNYWDHATQMPYLIRQGCTSVAATNLIDRSFPVLQIPQNCPSGPINEETDPKTECVLTNPTENVRSQYRAFYEEWLTKVIEEEYDTTHLWYDNLEPIVVISSDRSSLTNTCKHLIYEARTFRNEPAALMVPNAESLILTTPSSTNQVSIHPNPFDSQLNIMGLGGQVDIWISDILGRTVYNRSMIGDNQLVETWNWKPGIYFTEIYNHATNQSTKIKLMKQ